MLTDPVADMLTRIRNANKALHDHTEMPTSKLKEELARILKEEGYIRDFHVERREELPYGVLVVDLKYGRSRERIITDLKRISKPGRRPQAGPRPRAHQPRPEAHLEAGPPDLRAQGPSPARARRNGDRRPFDFPRHRQEPHRRARGHRRGSDLLRLVRGSERTP